MFFVNVIHKECNLIEYAVLETFLRFFGVSVYNSCCEELTDTFFDAKNDITAERVNIVIADSKEDIKKFLANTKNEMNIFVSAFKKTVEWENVIHFPKNSKSGKYREFLEHILQALIGVSAKSLNEGMKQECKLIENEKQELIDMFLNLDIINNWYIPIRAYRERRNVAHAIVKLNDSLEKYTFNKFEYIERQHIFYAYVHTKYMVNRMCAKGKFINIIPWEELFEDAENLSKAFLITKRAGFLAGEIYDESGKNNMLADHFYTFAKDSVDYYRLYRHGRLNEFRLNDKDKAKLLFKESVACNPSYYRSLYKLAMYYDEDNEYERAFVAYNQIVSLLYKRFVMKHWNITDLEYMIKASGRLMGLNRYFKSDSLIQSAAEKVSYVVNKIEQNKFFSELSEFVSQDEKAKEQLNNKMTEDIKKIANEHIQNFCIR